MNSLCKFALCLALLAPLAVTGGRASAQQAPKSEESMGIEVGKAPCLIVATSVCGPLEKEEPFNPATYGKVRGYNPIGSLHPPIVLYTSALTPEFFRLATALDTLIGKDSTLANSMVMLSDEKGAQRGGYTTEEIVARRESIRQLAQRNHISHLSFFLSAPGAKSVAPRLELTEKQDLLIAVLDNRTHPDRYAPVLSVQRMESSKLTADSCKKIVDSLASRKEKE